MISETAPQEWSIVVSPRSFARAKSRARFGFNSRRHIARPRHPVHKALFLPVRLLDGFELTRDVLDERVPALMAEVGFQGMEEVEARTTIFGALAWWRGRKEG